MPPLSLNRQAEPPTNNNNSGKEYNEPEKITKASDSTEDNEELFSKLRELRTQIAKRENVPASNVASDETLRKLSNIRPKNLAQLKFYEIGPFYPGTDSEFLTFINSTN